MGRLQAIIEMSVGLLLAGVLMPVALQVIANATGLTGVIATVFQTLLPIVAVIGVALYFIPQIKGG